MGVTDVPKFSTSDGRSNTWFTRRTLTRLTALLVLIFVAAAAVLVKIAFDQNQKELNQSLFYAEKALLARKDGQLRSISDYAFWGDAYQHLHAKVDVEWAYTRRNLGGSLFEDFGYEGIFVIGPDDVTAYAVIEGQLTKIAVQDWLQGDIGGLVGAARVPADDPQPIVDAFEVHGDPALVTAAPLTPGGDPLVAEVPGAPSVLLFVDQLKPAELKEFGMNYGLPELRKPSNTLDAEEQPRLALSEEPGRALYLRWDPSRPGDRLLVFLLPLLGLAGLTIAGLAWLTARHSLSAAKLLDASYATLQASEERFHAIAEAASDWLWEVDADLRFTFLSTRFTAVTGHGVDAWIGRHVRELLTFDDNALSEALSSAQEPDKTASLPCSYTSAEGKFCLCTLILSAINGPTGLTGYRGTACDTTALAESQLRIQHLQYFDSLTGLPNRKRLIDVLDAHLGAQDAQASSLALITISLARLKQLNDRLGRTGGDQILVQFAQRLERFFRPDDLIFRYTSDEFAVLLDSGEATYELIEDICKRLVKYVARPLPIAQEEFSLSIKMGIAWAPKDAETAQDLIRCSEIALYQARSSSIDPWCFFSPEQEHRIAAERKLESELRHAIARDELRLHFQSRHRAADLGVVGVEALVRWQHPSQGLLAPGKFIRLAEHAGLIGDLGTWVLRNACRQARSLPATVFVSVNLSAEQFLSPELVAQVQSVLDETGLPASRLELEITESMMLDDAQGALEKLQGLKALGIRLSMDDFGTGYSSLSYLGRYPFDTLKIDRSFITQLNAEALAIVRAIVQLGHALSMKVTAEGVEQAEQLTMLGELGCDEFQGFYLGRPAPLEDLRGLLSTGDRRTP
jgi:diguanylate cyclase (GGDEF)-like protein/PAS domain S-box-containing protein